MPYGQQHDGPTTKGEVFKRKEGNGEFGMRLKNERIRRKMGVAVFSGLVGVAQSQITGMENRGCYPRMDTAIAIARVLDCSLDWLFGLED